MYWYVACAASEPDTRIINVARLLGYPCNVLSDAAWMCDPWCNDAALLLLLTQLR
jgi:hypothetical protein